MKKITVKDIPLVLNEAYEKGTTKKPFSVLFVSELDDSVRFTIEDWIRNTKEKCNYNGPSNYYIEDEQGILRKTKEYGFSSCIEDAKISFLHYEIGYHDDLEWKSKEHEAYNSLINKTGRVIAKELKLSIITVLKPLWSSNTPMYGEKDYNMFDEVYEIELNVDVFKEQFISKIDKRIDFIKSEFGVDKANKLMEAKKIGLFILNHPKFHFIPIEPSDDDNTHFSPVDFYNIFSIIEHNNDINESIKDLRRPYFVFPQVAKDMLIEILEDYKKQFV